MNNESMGYKEDSFKIILNHYFKILNKEELSYSHKASYIPAENPETLRDMWKEHEQIQKNRSNFNTFTATSHLKKPSFSYLDLKIAITEKLFEKCVFCQRNCKINRNNEPGFCSVKHSKIASGFLHMGEETPLIPSHTIFFTGCTFKCVYCQNWDISQHSNGGMVLSPQEMANVIDRRSSEGSRNVNFVGGDPNPHLLYILYTIRHIKKNLPLIWNSNFYMSREAMSLLDGIIDLYLSDFKYGNDECAMRLSNIPDYWKVVTRNHKLARGSGDMIIRHLILPNHVECCTIPVLDWIYENLGEKVIINLMAQYRPVYKADNHKDISRFIYRKELDKAFKYAQKLGFLNLI